MNTFAHAGTPDLPSPRRAASWRGLNRHRGLLIAIGVWLLMMLFTIGSIGMTSAAKEALRKQENSTFSTLRAPQASSGTRRLSTVGPSPLGYCSE
jgi:type II secretory pathway component PulL